MTDLNWREIVADWHRQADRAATRIRVAKVLRRLAGDMELPTDAARLRAEADQLDGGAR